MLTDQPELKFGDTDHEAIRDYYARRIVGLKDRLLCFDEVSTL